MYYKYISCEWLITLFLFQPENQYTWRVHSTHFVPVVLSAAQQGEQEAGKTRVWLFQGGWKMEGWLEGWQLWLKKTVCYLMFTLIHQALVCKMNNPFCDWSLIHKLHGIWLGIIHFTILRLMTVGSFVISYKMKLNEAWVRVHILYIWISKQKELIQFQLLLS